ncbi:hypothetical protein J8273_7492 [Carpediemonas membranifera]|uniref:TLDc domain-containing protein n=1 Tax=Carpediemonas membranifera TaxID=201153 RepID=A0A8J6AY15_9EUKA|nr:hypothetical protein J8273_7492 [Carpediemonas membranifera]|eukprot:KAG9391218.1 hypothetical protein J8273_7492 [Carpediemonas membranifera]
MSQPIQIRCLLCDGMKKIRGTLSLLHYAIQFEPDADDSYVTAEDAVNPGNGHLKYLVNIKPSCVRHSALATHLPTTDVEHIYYELEHIVSKSIAARYHRRGSLEKIYSPVHRSVSRHSLDMERTSLWTGDEPIKAQPRLPRHYLLLSYRRRDASSKKRRVVRSHAYFLADAAQLLGLYGALIASVVSSKRYDRKLKEQRRKGVSLMEPPSGAGLSPPHTDEAVVALFNRAAEHLPIPVADDNRKQLAGKLARSRDGLQQVRTHYQLPPLPSHRKPVYDYPSDVTVDSFASSDEEIGIRMRASTNEEEPTPRSRFGRGAIRRDHPAAHRSPQKERTLPVFEPVTGEASVDHEIEQVIPSLAQAPSVPMTPNRPAVMTTVAFQTVLNAAPRVFTATAPTLLYSDQTHGRSLKTLYRNCEGFDATVLCIETELGGVIGAFVTSEWRPHQHRTYYGTGESFVFRAKGRACTLFPWSGANNSFQLCCNDILAVGGGGPGLGAAIYLTRTLEKGESCDCPTFTAPCLSRWAGSEDRTHCEFAVASIDVWGLHRMATGR